jgi:lipopolysaccharide/colanic/teichoic acid biosynthesis glycosyltransferase
MKFRTMVKNAEQIANRDTIAPQRNQVLNIVIDDALYTRLGACLEKIHFTELPQLLQVLQGTLTLVGNRPMPVNMLATARQLYPYIEERFAIPGGIAGPAQLVGRDRLSDQERLRLEITYCYICQESYNPLLDLHILVITTLMPFGIFHSLTFDKALELMMSYVNPAKRSRVLERINTLLGQP